MSLSQPSASEIGHALMGRTDAEILAWVDSVGGAGLLLEQAFWGMKEAFHAERAAGQSALIRWDIATPEGAVLTYELEVSDGECTVSRGAQGAPNVALSIALADFLRVVTGLVEGTEAYAQGKLGIHGDMRIANALSDWFKETH